ncbi:MAG: sce7726 family protein, partial [Chryseobacterium culicis]
KIGTSKADLVLLNGIIRIYEIKTELDDFTKLSKQLEDYQKFADKVYIVTNEKSAKKLILEYEDTNIGINILDSKNNFVTLKEARENTSFFDFETIFKVLRKNEYLDLVSDNFGIIPDVPNTKIFRFCYELLSQMDISIFQKQVLNKLKDRKLISPRLLKSSRTPKELKHICNSLNFNDKEYQNLYNFLKTNNPCINPT